MFANQFVASILLLRGEGLRFEVPLLAAFANLGVRTVPQLFLRATVLPAAAAKALQYGFRTILHPLIQLSVSHKCLRIVSDRRIFLRWFLPFSRKITRELLVRELLPKVSPL